MQKYDRNKAIFEMRRAEVSLQKIGDHFGISRERVRQILYDYFPEIQDENLFVTKNFHTKKLFENPEFISMTKNKTNSELADILSVSYDFISNHRGKYRHAIAGDTNANKGILCEEWVSIKLTEKGIKNDLMSYRSPFDILALDTIRIDVKAAYKKWEPPSRVGNSTIYRFATNKREGIDFYILVIVNTGDSFIIPIYEFKNHKSVVVFSWPIIRPCKNHRWQKYHEAWHLLVKSCHAIQSSARHLEEYDG